jgi:hypothetical protein
MADAFFSPRPFAFLTGGLINIDGRSAMFGLMAEVSCKPWEFDVAP